MAIFSRRRAEPTAVTAAAREIVAPGSAPVPISKATERQKRVWEFYDEIGEVHNAATYVANSISRLNLFVGVRPDPGSAPDRLLTEPDPDEPTPEVDLGYSYAEAATAIDTLERLKSPMGDQGSMMRRLALNLWVPGEGYLLGQPVVDDAGSPVIDATGRPCEAWDVYSVEEIEVSPYERRANSAGEQVPVVRIVDANGKKSDTHPDTVVYRIWQAHPRFRDVADSPNLAAATILDELLILTRAIRGAAMSRLKGPGMMFLPNSLRETVQARSGSAEGKARLDPVTKSIIDATSAAIEDPSVAAAHVPVIVWTNDAAWEKLVAGTPLITWDREVDATAAAQRAELITRYATTIDQPPEVLSGKGNVNHWGAWEISEDSFRQLEPFVQTLVGALTVSYLRPALDAAGVPDVDRFLVWYDPVNLIADPDASDRALKAHEADLISDASARRDLGYDEEDAPSEEELARRAAMRQTRQPRALDPAPVDRQEPQSDPPADQSGPDTVIAAASVVVEPGLVQLVSRLALADASLLRDVHARADDAVRRALERAANRLRSLAKRDPTARAAMERIEDPLLVGPTLGPALINALLAADDDEAATAVLFAGAFDSTLSWYDDRVTRAGDDVIREAAANGSLPPALARQHRADMDADRDESRALLLAALIASAGLLLRKPDVQPDRLGESDGALLLPGAVRPALIRAGGGGQGAVSMLTGDRITTVFADAGLYFEAWQWAYGSESWRHRPFEPHRALDGLTFSDAGDDRLGNASTAWPGVSHFWPGDHPGCQCIVVRTQVRRVERAPLVPA